MVFARDGEAGTCSTVTLPHHLQGYRGIAHGGIVMMLLDEGMAHACRFAGQKAMTASVDVRFRKPVPLGELLTVRGRVKEQRKNVLFLEAAIELDGVSLATADGKFLSLGPLNREEQARA
jgi:acyl-coenzyme A thioesterase PaaI-like protein